MEKSYAVSWDLKFHVSLYRKETGLILFLENVCSDAKINSVILYNILIILNCP